MSVLTDVLNKKDKKPEIPETEQPSEADLLAAEESAGKSADDASVSPNEQEPPVAERVADSLDAPKSHDGVPLAIAGETSADIDALHAGDTIPNLDPAETQAFDHTAGHDAALPNADKTTSTINLATEVSDDDSPASAASITEAFRQIPTLRDDKRKVWLLAGLFVGTVLAIGVYLFNSVQPSDNDGLVPDNSLGAFDLADATAANDSAIDTAEAPVAEAVAQDMVRREPVAEPAITSSVASTAIEDDVVATEAEVSFYDVQTVTTASADELSGAVNPGVEQVIEVATISTFDPVYNNVSQGYEALLRGDNVAAEQFYRTAVAIEPNNRDALLGLASVAQRMGMAAEAASYYEQLIALNPKDGVALAGLIAYRSEGQGTSNESTLKTMLREQPDAAPLHFTLAMEYVAQGRWPEAQGAFFEAARLSPEHADYNFNLAVSLDRLGKSDAAALYYARAIDLAQGSQNFDVNAAAVRLAALQASSGG